MTIRRLLLLPFFAGVLTAQVELETQLSMGTGGPSGKLVPLRTERYLFQDGALRTESGDWFVLSWPVNGAARVYVVNRKERKIAEGTTAELLESIRLRTPEPGKLAEQFKIASAPATPAAPAILWQGKTVPGQACKLRIEMAGLSTPLTMEQTIETYTTELEGDLAAAESARGSMGMAVQTQMVMPGFSAGDRLAAALADCFPQGRLLVRMEMTASSKALPVQTSVRYEVTKLRTGVRADAALFTPPATADGWTRVSLATAYSAYSNVQPSQAALAEVGIPAEPKSEDLLKQVDELKRLIEAGKWEQARSLESQISMAIYRRAEAAQPPPARRLAELEARLASGQHDAAQVEEAAEIALKLGDLAKAARFARLMTEDTSRDDVPHNGHTLLGLLAWRAGDKQQALAELAAAGKSAGSIFVSALGARMELAEKLAEDGEYEPVAEYVEACLRGASVRPETVRMYQRALEALRAKTKPYFADSYGRYQLPPR